MASLYPHTTSGYKVRYFLYFPDGTKKEVCRYSKNKQRAAALKETAGLLEATLLRGAATYEELVYFKHQGLISDEDLPRIASGRTAGAVTWKSLRKDYETYSKASHSPHNHKTTLSRLENLEKYFSAKPASSITVHDILAWQVKRRDEKAAVKTIRSERDALRQMLDIAVDHGAIPFNPARHKLLKASLTLDKSRLPRALTYDEVKQMFEMIRGEKAGLLGKKIYLAALIFLFGGLRRGELCYLTHKDIVGSEIIIQSKKVSDKETTDADVKRDGTWKPKGNRPRTIDLPDKVAALIRAMLPDSEERFIFGGKHVYHRDYISQEFEEVLKKIGKDLSLHSLRHTFVTWRIEHGISGKGDNLVRVQLVAGHADIQTTMNYTHIKISPEQDILHLA